MLIKRSILLAFLSGKFKTNQWLLDYYGFTVRFFMLLCGWVKYSNEYKCYMSVMK